MESTSRIAAIRRLEEQGVASSCHLLIADATGGTGLECSSEDIVRLEMDNRGAVIHTNHYVLPHKHSVIESQTWIPDTRFRLKRIRQLVNAVEEPSFEVVERLLQDQMLGDGASICRAYSETDDLATLFSIVMDLGERRARVCIGLPVDPSEVLELNP